MRPTYSMLPIIGQIKRNGSHMHIRAQSKHHQPLPKDLQQIVISYLMLPAFRYKHFMCYTKIHGYWYKETIGNVKALLKIIFILPWRV